MEEKEILVKKILEKTKGSFACGSESEADALRAYEMGVQYASTRRFDNSRFYHNYQFRLDDGTRIQSTSYFNIFMSRNQTGAYIDAEKALREIIDDEKARETIFRLVRDQRFGINGVFKAIMSPKEPQQLNYIDFVLIIACFCAGVVNETSSPF